MNLTEFFVASGTLMPDAPSYVERQADEELFAALARGQYCYVLTARQMGKSSLMVRTAKRLREAGLGAKIFDPTGTGRNLTIDQWYVSLLNWIGRGFEGIEAEIEKFWLSQPLLSPVQRCTQAISQIILPRLNKPLVIFVDEIDSLQSLPFPMDEFFAAIRECYNRRAEDHAMENLTFCLLGVATPSDLIRDTRTTPFNIGRRIELHDFTVAEASSLARGLQRDQTLSLHLLNRVMHWTGGHPYLTQRLCQAVANDSEVGDDAGVDRLCHDLFLTRRARELDDNLLFVRDRLLRNEKNQVELLDLYATIQKGKRVAIDGTHPLINKLRLSGITRAEGDWLRVRNRIYERVFDAGWVESNLPDAEARQRRKAYRRGLLRAGLVGASILLLVSSLAVVAWREARESRRTTYYAEIRVAQQELDNADISRVEEILLSLKSQKELRGFEWDYLWNASHQQEQSVHLEYPVETVAFSPDGQQIILAESGRLSGDGKRMYRISSFDRSQPSQEPTRLKSFETEFRGIFRLIRFSANAQRALIGDGERAAGLFDLQSNSRAALLNAHQSTISALAVSPDGSRIVTADNKGGLRFAEISTDGKIVQAHELTEPAAISQVVFSADGQQVMVLSDNLSVWDFTAGNRLSRFDGAGHETFRMAFSPSKNQAMIGTRRGELQSWDIHANQLLKGWKAHAAPVTELVYSPDGAMLATGSEDRTVKLWDAIAHQELATIKGNGATINRIAWSTDGKLLAVASNDKTVKIWNVEKAIRQKRGIGLSNVKPYLATAFDRNHELLAVGVTSDQKTKLLSLSSGVELLTLVGASPDPIFAAFAPDTNLLAVHGGGTNVQVWNIGNAENVATLAAAPGAGYVIAADFSSDGKRLAFVYDSQTVKVWSTESWQELAAYRVKTPQRLSYRVVFSPNGGTLAAACADGSVALWQSNSAEPVFLYGHSNAVRAIAFSPDGSKIATGGADLTLRLWDAATREPLQAPRQAGLVQRLTFSPDGKRIVSGSYDGTVKIWEVATGREMLSLPNHSDEIQSITFSQDGKSLATSSRDGVVRFWKMNGAL